MYLYTVCIYMNIWGSWLNVLNLSVLCSRSMYLQNCPNIHLFLYVVLVYNSILIYFQMQPLTGTDLAVLLHILKGKRNAG